MQPGFREVSAFRCCNVLPCGDRSCSAHWLTGLRGLLQINERNGLPMAKRGRY